MDHDRYGLDGVPIYSQGVDVCPVTGEPLRSNGRGFGFEPYTITFVVLALCFIVFFAYEARVFG